MFKALTSGAMAGVVSGLITQFILTSVLWWPLLLWCIGVAFVLSYLGVVGKTMLVLGALAVPVGLLAMLVTPLVFIPSIFLVFGVGAVASSLTEMIVPVTDG